MAWYDHLTALLFQSAEVLVRRYAYEANYVAFAALWLCSAGPCQSPLGRAVLADRRADHARPILGLSFADISQVVHGVERPER